MKIVPTLAMVTRCLEEDFAITDNFQLGSRKNVEPFFGGEYWYTGVSFRNTFLQ